MRDYVSQLWTSLGKMPKAESSKPRARSQRSMKSESAHTDSIKTVLANLEQFRRDFQEKIAKPAAGLNINTDSSFIKGGDKQNPHIRAIYRIEEAIDNLRDQLKAQLTDPFKDEDGEDVGADAPLNGNDMAAPAPATSSDNLNTDMTLESRSRVRKVAESYKYYKSLHPDVEELLQLNGWTYSNNEIWDDSGVCSITYEPDEDKIFVFELMDPDGVDQELVAQCDNVDELDSALTNFVELSEIAPEMKAAFAEYIEQQRSQNNEEVVMEAEDFDAIDEPSTDVVSTEPIIIDEWEYLAQDPEFNGNPTLLYDKGEFVVFLQKDSDPENDQPFYVNALSGQENLEHVFADIDSLCTWLGVNELPVPTDDAKLAFSGAASESVNEAEDKKKNEKPKCKLPDGMKEVKDDPAITTLAPEVEAPKVAKVEEPKNKK